MNWVGEVASLPYKFGITVMPEWFQHEGIDAVFDRVQAAGASAIATSPYLLERCPAGEGGREPPPDGEAGKVRPLERSLFGAKELWVRASPAFEHDLALYRGLRYRPAEPTALTKSAPRLLDKVMETAQRRGIAVFFQIMAASPPAYRVQFSSANDEDQCYEASGTQHHKRVDRNASLASEHVLQYLQVLLGELGTRYPSVAGFRLDWPEYPPYDLRSALFDFNPSTCEVMRSLGDDPERVRAEAIAWARRAREVASKTARWGAEGVMREFEPLVSELLQSDGALQGLFKAKSVVCSNLLQRAKKSLEELAGPRRRLEPQAFPPPFHQLSGFPLHGLKGVADAVGIKLYTMHWPMLARYWARDLVGEVNGEQSDAISAALGRIFGLVDTLPTDPSGYRYPSPAQSHPVGERAQIEKLAIARKAAAGVPVVAFAHAYGPIDDVLNRFEIARANGDAVWINRYGYLSDEKLNALGEISRVAS